MAQRKSIDCRDYPSEKNCSLKMSGTEQEVLDASSGTRISAHGQAKIQLSCEQLKSMLKDAND